MSNLCIKLGGPSIKPLTAVCHPCQAHVVCASIKCYFSAELFKDRPYYKEQHRRLNDVHVQELCFISWDADLLEF